VIFGYAAFLLFLCFWQRIRLVIFKPLVVFVDKLCIAQHDDVLKEKGILGLAGFVDHSKKLTILWSPRYFSRLWCTYEIAAFLRDQVTDEKPLQVMPVKMSVILFLLSFCWHILTICFYVLEYVTDDDTGMLDEILVGAFVAAFLMLTMPIVCYIGIGLMKDIQELPNQLKTFRVQESKCFCCSHNHVHPETGRRIICDRQLVFKTLKRWFGAEGNTLAHLTLPTCRKEEQHLDAFNFLVQSDLAQTVLKSVGGDTLPFSYAVYMVSICNVPFLAQYMASWKA
ncbi:ABCF5, partial [Symbiodinium sp. CCMP2456]